MNNIINKLKYPRLSPMEVQLYDIFKFLLVRDNDDTIEYYYNYDTFFIYHKSTKNINFSYENIWLTITYISKDTSMYVLLLCMLYLIILNHR
jgi:hypothetical protein